MRKTLRVPLFAIVFGCTCTLVAFAGCSRSATTSSANSSPSDAVTSGPAKAAEEIDPCKVLSRAEVGAILKGTVAEPRRNGDSCTWMTAPTNLVTIEMHTTDGKTLMTGSRGGSTLIGAKASKVSGIGDEAFYGAGDSVLYALEGERYVSVDLRGVQKPRAVGPALAKATLAHLRR